MNPTVISFCEQHGACVPELWWAIRTGCKTMAQLWDRTDMPPEWRIWAATRDGVCDDVDLRLFACWCATRVPQKNPARREQITTAILFSLGLATTAQLRAARDAGTPCANEGCVSHAAHLCTFRLATVAACFAAYYAANAHDPGHKRKARRKEQAKQLVHLVGNPFNSKQQPTRRR